MNKNLLQKNAQHFINSNLDTDISRLLFKGSPFKTISIQELVEQIESKNKCKLKLPSWYNTANIIYPNKLHIEQASSEITAEYKSKLISGKSIIDITGGYGIDCYYFSRQFKQLTYCEINPLLAEITKHNFNLLNITNCNHISGNGLDYMVQSKTKYDCIYVDPSRRNDAKGKVYYLKDCSPNLIECTAVLFKFSDYVMVKTSPMLDISKTILDLSNIKEVNIIGIKNEVKEVVYILQKGFNSKAQIKTININPKSNEVFSFFYGDESYAKAYYTQVKSYLYEPNSAVLKSGAFNLISQHFGIDKLHRHTHLYTSDKLLDFPGKTFKINYVIPYNKKQFYERIPSGRCNIKIRNFPDNALSIQKKFNLKNGGRYYVFFTSNYLNKKIILITEKL